MSKPHIIVISLVLAAVLLVFLAWPKYQNLQEIQNIIEKKQVELQNKTDYFVHLRDLHQKLAEYEGVLAKISSALPRDASLPALFNYFQKTPAREGLFLEGISFEGTAFRKNEPERIKEIRLAVSLTGDYSAFKRFLSTVENSARLFKIENISFSAPIGPEESFSFRVKLKTHSY